MVSSKLLNTFGKNPIEWEIYRGDEFQLEVKNPEEALIMALQIKSYFKSIKLVCISFSFSSRIHRFLEIELSKEENKTKLVYY